MYAGSPAFAVALNSCGLLPRVPGIFPGITAPFPAPCEGATRPRWDARRAICFQQPARAADVVQGFRVSVNASRTA